MTKKREKSAAEFWKAKARELDKKYKQVSRELTALKNRAGKLPRQPKLLVRQKDTNLCPECGKGQMKEVDLYHKIIINCSVCGHQIKKEKVK